MTMNEAVQAVAQHFLTDMVENGFETFAEMKQSYWWDNEDIAGEIAFVLDGEAGDTFVDEDDKSVWASDEDAVELKVFMRRVNKQIKKMMEDAE